MLFLFERQRDDPRAAKGYFSLVRIFDKLVVNVIDGRKFTDSVASPSNSLEGAHAHAINTRPSFLPRGAGSEAIIIIMALNYSIPNLLSVETQELDRGSLQTVDLVGGCI